MIRNDQYAFFSLQTYPQQSARLEMPPGWQILVQQRDDNSSFKRGTSSGVDRVHTAFHGYLKEVCRVVALTARDDAGVTDLLTLLREKDPAFNQVGPRDDDINRVLRSMSAIVDARNPNKASAAHPNDRVLEHPEAMLVINCFEHTGDRRMGWRILIEGVSGESGRRHVVLESVHVRSAGVRAWCLKNLLVRQPLPGDRVMQLSPLILIQVSCICRIPCNLIFPPESVPPLELTKFAKFFPEAGRMRRT